MRALLLFAVVAISANLASAQTQPSNPPNQPKPGSQPPSNGNIPPSPNGNMAPPPKGNMAPPPNGNMAPPPQGNMAPPPNGNMPQPPGGQPNKGQPNFFPAEKCEKEAQRLEKMAMNCVKIKKEDQRAKCFAALQPKFPPGFWEVCRGQTDAIKAKVEQTAAEKHPGQASGIPQGGDKPGDMPKGQPGPNGQAGAPPNAQPAKECPKMVAKLRQEADKCLKIKTASKDKGPNKRKECFDKVGEHIQKEKMEEMCGEVVTQMKTEYQNKEAQMYPNDPPSIQ